MGKSNLIFSPIYYQHYSNFHRPPKSWTEEQEEELRRLYMENQENPQTDQDVIDWILDNLIDKTRTRRGVLKKLKELGLIFKAPTKRSNAGRNKNLWQHEEDEKLKELYDTYRLDPKPLVIIIENLEIKRSKNEVIKRMITLGLIADKSEIVPTRKKKSKVPMEGHEGVDENEMRGETSENDLSESDSDVDSDEENNPPIFAVKSTTSNSLLKQLKSNSIKPAAKKRVIKKSTLDLKSINVLRNEIEESHKDALDWIIEAFNEAADDFEEISDEPDDAIPIVPITAFQIDAVENVQFKKLMTAVGIQKPDSSVSLLCLQSVLLSLNPKTVSRQFIFIENFNFV